MTDAIPWPIIASFCGGGAMGAIIKSVVDLWRDRVQPITYSIECERLFTSVPSDSGIHTKVAVFHDEKSYGFKNLSLVRVRISNSGNADMANFPFGITLSNGDKVLILDYIKKDRHHNVLFANRPTPAIPATIADIELQPFNRRDSYELRLFVVLPEDQRDLSQLTLSSKVSARFVKTKSLDEIFDGLIDLKTMSLGQAVAMKIARWMMRVLRVY